ncbi:MAG: oligosaccharyl transferase, archaeosortase A system-associated [ANME-2 cluster archaeon]|nr:oligosaccharyl transferase, archaeosortase A system-associated [ANME-2 cluster archaeon]
MTEKSDDMPDPKPEKAPIISSLKNMFSIYTPFVIFIFALALYIRTVLPYDAVFRGGIVGFAADDAVFHMRLVENLLKNFPHRIWFETFTLYPYGQSIHFGPLWTYMIAITSLILGAGSPSLDLTRMVGAYFPGIFGALLVFPVYFMGREVFDRRVGLLAAFMIAVMPGQILSRSIMGFTDHHAGEVFFSTLYLMFLIMAINSVKGMDISVFDILEKNWAKIKHPAIISIISGVAFSLYMLQWSNGVFFGGIVAIFIVLQFIIYHMKNQSSEGLSFVSFISFLSAFPLILFFVDPMNSFSAHRYSYLHILITLGSAIFFLILGLLSIKMREKNIERIYYPLTIVGIYATGLVIAKLFIPSVFSSFATFFTIFQPREGGGLTIAEASPPRPEMIFGYAGYPNNFGNYPGIFDFVSTYYIALLAMVVIGAILIFRKWEPEKAMFLIWCFIMFALTTGQNRWFYYYSVNVAILSSFIGIGLLDIAGFKDLSLKLKTRVSTPSDLQEFITSDLSRHLLSALIVAVVIMLVFLPNFNVASRSTAGGATSSDYYQWYESMNWMRYNTPDPGLDFDAVYDRPPAGETFPYPDTAYGVMSWWDYGHVITYFGHRIPNANPFQAGIGGGPSHAPGASTFFTAQSEEDADEVLWNLGINDKPGSRYIVSNAYMAYAINDVMGIWDGKDWSDFRTYAVISGQQQLVYKQYWYTSMEGRLHIFDGDGLKHYRLVHESLANPYASGGNMEQSCKAQYNMLYSGNLKIENTGFVKIFEFVEGATITGSAPDNAIVTLSNDIMTNQGRLFTYTQTTTVQNGTFSFEVPYSTLGPVSGQTNFDTRPIGPYTLTVDTISKTVDVAEQDVLNGGTLTVNMME